MPLSTQEWHARFQEQATWTDSIRSFLLESVPFPSTARILEVGCGTGAVLENFSSKGGKFSYRSVSEGAIDINIHGLDINKAFLTFAKSTLPFSSFVRGDALSLPYKNNSFNITYCHFLLMWIDEPRKSVLEMQRVTLPGGIVIAFAEPDYGGRIDFPPELEELGKLQTQALASQGADPLFGRKLASVFFEAGLIDIKVGVLGGNWRIGDPIYDSDNEWEMILSDLEDQVSEYKINRFKNLARKAHEKGTRILYVPTFYIVGYVTENF